MDFVGILQVVLADGHALVIPSAIDYFAIIVGVVTGALVACDRKLDVVGTTVAGLVTGFGGGIVRDLLMQDYGVYFMQHPGLVVACAGICVVVFHVRGLLDDPGSKLFFLDTLSVALFALAGASKAFACDQGFALSIILGAITAVGGGALRDALTGVTPAIFKASSFYAIAGLGGAVAYVVLAALGCPVIPAAFLSVCVVLFLRYGSIRFGWRTRSESDVPNQVRRLMGKGDGEAGSLAGRDGDAEAESGTESASDEDGE